MATKGEKGSKTIQSPLAWMMQGRFQSRKVARLKASTWVTICYLRDGDRSVFIVLDFSLVKSGVCAFLSCRSPGQSLATYYLHLHATT